MTSPALVHRGSLQLVKEVTYGTDPGTGYTASSILSEGIKAVPKYIFNKGIRASRASSNMKIPGEITVGGDIKFNPDPSGIVGLLLKGLLTSETYTDNHVAGNGYSHVFVPADTVPPTFSCLINRDTSPSANNVYDYTGGMVEKLSFSCKYGALVECTAQLSFQTGTDSATPAAPSYNTEQPLVFHMGSVTLAGNAINVAEWTCEIDGGILNKRGKIGSKLIQQQQPGLISTKGTLTAYLDGATAQTMVDTYLNGGSDAALVFTMTGAALSSANEELVITVPVAQFTGNTPNPDDPAKEVMLKMNFEAWLSGAGSPNALVQVMLINNTSGAY